MNGLFTILSTILIVGLFLPIKADAGINITEVIEGRKEWSGEVTVKGVVIVKKGAMLTVARGTVVRFFPEDLDGDGIGDAELRVEGSIYILGTEKEPVVFTSASERPAPADWKFLMINHADEARVEYAVFEYAFSGVQIHYTRGTFRKIVSRHNVDGFRFSTAPVVLEDSILMCNENGIRYEERGAGAVIRNNIISGNRVGIFAVVKCKGLTSITGNNIAGNRSYNVKMGIEQTRDINISGNWFGHADPEKVAESFFDGRIEPELGTVQFEPTLKKRSETSGPGDKLVERWSCL